MITGEVTAAGVPMVNIDVAGSNWDCIIDTGFNGDLELPSELQDELPCRYIGQVTSLLAGGQRIDEEAFQVEFPFDGQAIQAEATFATGPQILIGTRLLRSHRLSIDFLQRTVVIERS